MTRVGIIGIGHGVFGRRSDATVQELSEKCRIYGSGCLKRGRIDEGQHYLSLLSYLTT